MNVILVGFMGTGKSAVGKRLSEKLGFPFTDMDELIEKRAGKSIPRIFKEDGEPSFRAMEREIVKELAEKRGMVIAAGGGVVLNQDNIADFERSGLVVCLSASEEELLRRLASSRDRPLLEEGSMREKISNLLESRRLLYNAIPHQVDTGGLTVDEVAERILCLYRRVKET